MVAPLHFKLMKALTVTASLLLSALVACSTQPRPHTVSHKPLGVSLSTDQQQQFVAIINNTPWSDLESDLPRKLASLNTFKPYFSMYELASTAYRLVLDSPNDMNRWRALAKLDGYDDGEYGFPYRAARSEALSSNPRLFEYCPKFRSWSDQFRSKGAIKVKGKGGSSPDSQGQEGSKGDANR